MVALALVGARSLGAREQLFSVIDSCCLDI